MDLASLTAEELVALDRDWRFWARPNQVMPTGDWDTWVVLAGRGYGKTRLAVEADLELAADVGPSGRWLVCGATRDDARKIAFEGESGFLSRRPEWRDGFNRQEIVWTTPIGTFYGYGAEELDRFRGHQYHGAWLDEFASYPHQDELLAILDPALRLGRHPRTIITTTPRPTKTLRAVLAGDRTVVTRGTTFENEANLAEAVVRKLRARYEGTYLGRQELYAEMIDSAPGALWQREWIRTVDALPSMLRIVIAVDPAGGVLNDEAGVVACGLGVDHNLYVIADRSGLLTANGWSDAAIELYDELTADMIVVEKNFGGDMVETTLRNKRVLPVKSVFSSRGKELRAQPIASIYERAHNLPGAKMQRIFHSRGVPQLEDELCTWVPGSRKSPGRLDAAVFALTELTEQATEPVDWNTYAKGGFALR